MQDAASYVPLGRDNTGAAAILRPFDSSKIFADYDKSRQPPKRPLLDSFGVDITKTGAVDPKDRWYVSQALRVYVNAKAKIDAVTVKERRDANPEELMQLNDAYMNAMDRVSKLQNDYKYYQQERAKIARDPYAYPEGAMAELDAFWNTPADKRGVAPAIKKVPIENYTKWLQGMGDPWRKASEKTRDAEGNVVQQGQFYFDAGRAKQNFDEVVWPSLQMPTRQAQGFNAAIRERVREAAEKQGQDYDSMPVEQQVEVFRQVALDTYMDIQKNRRPTQESSAFMAPAPSRSGSGKGQTDMKEVVRPVFTRQYAAFNPSGRVKATQLGKKEGQRNELVDVVGFSVAQRFGTGQPGDPKEVVWNTNASGTQKQKGMPQNFRWYKKNANQWESYPYIEIAYTVKGVNENQQEIETVETVEVPLTGENLNKFTQLYGYNPVDVLNERYPNWRNAHSKLPLQPPGPETVEGWEEMSDAKRDFMMQAYERRAGKAEQKQQQEVKTEDGGQANMIEVEVNGQLGRIPENQWQAFKKKYPNATRK